MRIAHGLKRLIVSSTILLVASGLLSTTRATADSLPNRAIDYIASRLGVGKSELRITATSLSRLPLTGRRLASYKVALQTGREVTVSFDENTGAVIDETAAERAEAAARRTRYGTIDPALWREAIRSIGPLSVALWLKMPSSAASGRTKRGIRAVDHTVRGVQAPVLETLSAVGVRAQPARLVPIVFAHLDAAQIRRFARLPEVAAVYSARSDATLQTDDSATSDRFSYAWSQASGSGAIVAVHENDGVDDVNTFLNNGTHPVVYWSDTVAKPKNIKAHATGVAGVIASTHNWRRGGAFGIGKILSANFQDFNDPVAIADSAAWAINQGARIINMSWGGCTQGQPDVQSRWVDYLVATFGVSVVVAAGNAGNDPNCTATPWVDTPALGWNTIAVGSYFDKDTGLRSDDSFSSFSLYKNPLDTSSGRTYEKPDVTGMGGENSGGCRGVDTTGVGGGVTQSTCGTSFSAPEVSALAALIGLSGEANKAIIMAGATHNIVDGAGYTKCPSSPIPGDCRDGAGAIDARQTIANVAKQGNYQSATVAPESFGDTGTITRQVTFSQGNNVRVALAWDSTSTCTVVLTGCDTDVLNADLDLAVADPDGNEIASSDSFQNSAEVVDFKAPSTGTYTITIGATRFDSGTSTTYGLAWNPDTADSINPTTGATVVPLNTKAFGQTTDKGHSFWDAYKGGGCKGFLSHETGLEHVYQVTTPSQGTLSASFSKTSGFPGVNGDIDLIELGTGGSPNALNNHVLACGDTSLASPIQPAGTYFVVVDGKNGSVGSYNLSVKFKPSAPRVRR